MAKVLDISKCIIFNTNSICVFKYIITDLMMMKYFVPLYTQKKVKEFVFVFVFSLIHSLMILNTQI